MPLLLWASHSRVHRGLDHRVCLCLCFCFSCVRADLPARTAAVPFLGSFLTAIERSKVCVCGHARMCVCVCVCCPSLTHHTHTHPSPLPRLTSALASHFSTDEWQAEDGCQQPQASKEAVYVAHTRAHAFLCPCNAVPRFLNSFMQCKVESVHVLTTTPLLLPPLPSSLSLSITVDMTKQIARHVDCLSSLEKV